MHADRKSQVVLLPMRIVEIWLKSVQKSLFTRSTSQNYEKSIKIGNWVMSAYPVNAQY